MSRQSCSTYFDKYLNTENGKNYMKGILALGCVRNGIADKVDRIVKKQFEGHVEKKMKQIKKLHQSDNSKCTRPNAKCSDHNVLCNACKRIFDKKMFCEIENISGEKNVSKANSDGIANHCDFAKAFIQLGGYLEKENIQEIDCSGLMKIVINNKAIQTYFGNISIFEAVLKCRNNIHHNELTLDTESFNKALDAMIQLLCEQKDMPNEEAKARQQQEGTSTAVCSEDDLLKHEVQIPVQDLEIDDIEVDTVPEEHASDENENDLATASYENSSSEVSQSDGLRKKMDEALEYLKKLKKSDFRFSSNDEIEFLRENLFAYKREIDNIDKCYSEKIQTLQKEIEIMKTIIADLKNNRDGDFSCDLSDRANVSRGESDQPRDTSNSSVCSRMPSKNWEDDIRLYEKMMPGHLQLGYIDVLILHNEEDTESAFKFQQHLQNDIKLDDGEKIKAILADGPEIFACGGTHLEQLQIGYDRCTFIFIYVTKRFLSQKWDTFVAESCLKERLKKDELDVFAIYTEKPTYTIPLGWNVLKRFDYYINDEIYKKKMSMTISKKIGERKLKDEKHKIEQIKWIDKHKKQTNDVKKSQRQLE